MPKVRPHHDRGRWFRILINVGDIPLRSPLFFGGIRVPLKETDLFRIVLSAFLAGSLCVSAMAASPATGTGDSPQGAFSAALREAIGAPARADLEDQATLRLNGDSLLIPKEPAIRLLTASNRPIPKDFAALLVGSEGMESAGIVTIVRGGFVDSDAAIAWTADDLLASLKLSVEHQNPARIQHGLQPLEARRWLLPPSYDPERHQISWAAMIIPQSAPRESDGEVTFHAIGFGRDGYIHLAVTTSEQQAEPTRQMVASFLAGLNFQPGNAYTDVQSADRRSPEGLAGAMGIEAFVKARPKTDLWSSDKVLPIAGGLVAAIGAVALAFNIARQMRRNSRRI